MTDDSNTTNDADEEPDDEPTFDIELADATAHELAAIVGGLGLLVSQLVHAAQRGADVGDRLDELGDLNQRILLENKAAARYMLIEADISDDITGIADEEFLGELGIVIEGGELYRAEEFEGEFTDIEVE